MKLTLPHNLNVLRRATWRSPGIADDDRVSTGTAIGVWVLLSLVGWAAIATAALLLL